MIEEESVILWFSCKARGYRTAAKDAPPDKVFEQVYRLFGCCICPFGFSATVSMSLFKEVAKGKKSKVFQRENQTNFNSKDRKQELMLQVSLLIPLEAPPLFQMTTTSNLPVYLCQLQTS